MASLYAVCSSTLSIVNKWALLGLPYPGLVTACQFLTTAVVVSIAGTLKYIDVEPLRKDKLMQMAPINIVFYLAIFTNGQVLKYATVEAFIAFRIDAAAGERPGHGGARRAGALAAHAVLPLCDRIRRGVVRAQRRL